MSERVPDLMVERLHLGELAPAEAERVRARLAAEPGGLARLDALAADDAATRAAHPRLPARAAPSSPRGLRWGAALAAAVAVLLLVVRPAAEDGTRAKGGGAIARSPSAIAAPRSEVPALVLYMEGPSGRPEPIDDGVRLGAGARVQVAYRAAGRGLGTIVSVDGRGAITTHLPFGPLQVGEVPLAHGFVLDDAPAFERFLFFTVPSSGQGLEVTTFTVWKP